MQSIAAGVQVSENSVDRFSFTWEMEGFSLADSGGQSARIFFKNQNVELGDSGQPAIPGFSFYVGIAPQADFQVRFTPLSTRTISLNNSLNSYKAEKRIARYPDLVFSDPWLSNGRPVTMGNIRCLQFILKPFIYNEKTHSLQVLQRASYTITFTGPRTGGAIALVSSDYQRMLSRLILNYAVAGKWPATAGGMAKRAGGPMFPLAPDRPMIGLTIGDGHDGTSEGTINENGVVKIPGDSLKKLGSGLLMSQVACYGSFKGEMPTQTPDIAALPDGITEIPLLRFDLNNNGMVDSEDYVLVYVTGASDWSFDTSSRKYYYRLNRYEDYRHYWITLKQGAAGAGLQRMTPVLGSAGATLTAFRNHLLLKQPQEISYRGGDVSKGERSGLDWRWAMLTQQMPSFTFQAQLPGIDTAYTAEMRIILGDCSGQLDMNATFSNAVVCTTCQASTWYRFSYRGNRTLTISAGTISQNDHIEIIGLEFRYITDLDMSQAKSLTVFSPETSSIVRYQIRNLPAEPLYIFRIAADESMRVDTLHPQQGSSCAWQDSAGKGVKYFISAQSGFLPTPSCPVRAVASPDNAIIRDLRSGDNPSVNQADYLVISHPDFMDQAKRLAAHKLKMGRFKTPKAVDVTDIYREFSGGNLDPAAIRNFLVYTHTLWGVGPQYVVLMGKGHYNYKGIRASEPVFIPVFESTSQCIEDFYAYLAPGTKADSSTIPVPDVYIGRLPCITADQARVMVDKIVGMEDPSLADFGAWRNRMLLVNDDDMQGPTPDGLRTDHLDGSEAVGQKIAEQRPAVDIRKVNLFEYPWNEVYHKPEARDALMNTINGGVAFVNYFGHGSNGQWADEVILDPALIASFHNTGQCPLMSSFSCSVGKFDQPGARSLAEYLVLAGQSGAIATVSSVRLAFSENNKQLALAFYGGIFDSARSGISCGEAYTEAKIVVHDQNSQIYSYLGDPSICPVTPLHRVTLDIHNNSGASVDTLMALQSITIKGTVSANGATAVDTRYGAAEKHASVQISVLNPPIETHRKDGGTQNDPKYSLPGTPLFTGQVDVKNGVFEQPLHVPRNVTFNKTGAKIIAFSWQAFDNGVGCKDIVFHGTDTSGIMDTVGPTIAIRTLYDDPYAQVTNNSTNIMALSAGKVQAILPFKCEIVVSAPNGIDVTGTGPDEGLTMEVPGNLAKQNINSKFSYSGGDYRKGSATVEFSEGQLPPGTYTLSVSAQDLAGNITKRNFTLDISKSQDLAITRVFNFPNPMKMGKTTAFYFDLSKLSNVRSVIKLYTMSGKLLRVFHDARSGEVFDGRDQMGNLLGPKVYLYQLIAEDMDQQKTVKSAIQKLAVHPPR